TVEYPRWSRRRIEVITKSSADSYHGTFNFLFRDYHLNARDALATERPQEQRRIFEGSLFGPVGNSKNTSFLFSGAREREDLVAVVFAQSPFGAVNTNVPVPQVNSVASLRLSRQGNQKQAMFWQVNFQDRWQNNVGAGGTTLAEAAAQNRFREDEFTFNHRAIFNPRFLSQFRILIGRYWSPTRSNTQAPRIVVTDAFTGGGAQADRLTTEFHTSITWLLTATIGRHALKYGFNIPDWSRRGLRDQTNRIGSLSYASLADFQAARPFAAVLQRGDPKLVFIEKNVGGFLQDEWQMRPNLSVSAGLRYDWQNYFGDANNVQPRLAIAYAPDKTRRWVLRTGAGFFFERSGPGPILDILRFNGARLRRYVLNGSSIPPDLVSFDGRGLPTSLHRLGTDVELPGILQFGASVERQLTRRSLLSIGYTGVRGVQQLRSRDANSPLPPSFTGRPDASVNVLRFIESAGRLEGNALEVTLRGDIAPRVSGMAQYVFGKTRTDTGGVNWFPADSFAPRGEWGRADADRRSQWNFLGTASLHRWLNFGVSASVLSGLPFNLTTGRDDNRDGMAIDRPPGAARNTGKGPGAVVLDLRWYREFRVQPSKKDRSPSLTVSIDAFNIPNRVNYQNYIGALTSPFFGRAVATLPPRRMQAGLRLQF
ncbi:MAG: TonB-dependent receptor domain-containing protein, partial [Bryobacteraceae bacterium]